jgi:hypothetical protein
LRNSCREKGDEHQRIWRKDEDFPAILNEVRNTPKVETASN